MKGYPDKLSQVFINLLINASQAMQDGGILTVETESLENTVAISFTDTGPGISPVQLPRLFDAFYTTKEVGKGTGLGLSISHSIVSRHGGWIEVDSKPGEGAKFTVVLPIGEASPATGGVVAEPVND